MPATLGHDASRPACATHGAGAARLAAGAGRRGPHQPDPLPRRRRRARFRSPSCAAALPALLDENAQLRRLLDLERPHRARLHSPPKCCTRRCRPTAARCCSTPGTADGVAPLDPVVTPEGLIGVIREVDRAHQHRDDVGAPRVPGERRHRPTGRWPASWARRPPATRAASRPRVPGVPYRDTAGRRRAWSSPPGSAGCIRGAAGRDRGRRGAGTAGLGAGLPAAAGGPAQCRRTRADPARCHTPPHPAPLSPQGETRRTRAACPDARGGRSSGAPDGSTGLGGPGPPPPPPPGGFGGRC